MKIKAITDISDHPRMSPNKTLRKKLRQESESLPLGKDSQGRILCCVPEGEDSVDRTGFEMGASPINKNVHVPKMQHNTAKIFLFSFFVPLSFCPFV